MKNYINDFIDDNKDRFDFDIYKENVIIINNDFKINKLCVAVTYYKAISHRYYNGYDPKRSHIDKVVIKNGEKYHDVDIRIVVWGDDVSDLIYRTLVAFEHEMTHAYTDIKMADGKHLMNIVSDDRNYLQRAEYKTTFEINDNTRDFLYIIDGFERNATIGQLWREFDELNVPLKTEDDIMAAFKKTDAGKQVEFINRYVAEVDSIRTRLNELLMVINKSKDETAIEEYSNLKCKYNTYVNVFKKLSKMNVGKQLNDFTNKLHNLASKFCDKVYGAASIAAHEIEIEREHNEMIKRKI
jgi:hypothetical protein